MISKNLSPGKRNVDSRVAVSDLTASTFRKKSEENDDSDEIDENILDLSRTTLAIIYLISDIAPEMGSDEIKLMLNKDIGNKPLLKYLKKAKDWTVELESWIL